MDTPNTPNGNSQDSPSIQPHDLLIGVPLTVHVEVGRTTILVKELLQLREGHIVELNKEAGDPLDLYVNNRLIARGEVVMIGESKYGLRLTELANPEDRISPL